MTLALTPTGSAQTFKTLFSFTTSDAGGYPGSALVQGTDGNLYGTTLSPSIVFKMTPDGILTTLYTFTGEGDGSDPFGLTLGTDGVLYGITQEGGSRTNCGLGCGTVFKITETGLLTTLHSFAASDGTYPAGTLVQGTDGNFYGTTAAGGANSSCNWQGQPGCGTIFKISSSGTFTTLHSFSSADGSLPAGGLIQGSDGNFYGTTSQGGAYSGGTVFKLTAGGTLTTLHNFCAQTGCNDGQAPDAGLMQAADGNFYGATADGGNQYCWYDQQAGTIFKITSKGKLMTLHSFCYSEGRFPEAPLIQATDGNLYGSAELGGNGGNGNCTAVFDPGCGTLFKVALNTALTTPVHTFDYSDGDRPTAALVQATSGALYGTTGYGGTGIYQAGTVFSLSFGAPPFVTLLPATRKAGQLVAILGTDLTSATSVTFNGTPATFTVVSSTEISATVPSGATTGPVVVTTPAGVLTSNKNFTVSH